MNSVICTHFRAGTCTKQCQLQSITIHADSIFTVIQHRCTMCAVSKCTVTVIAYFKPIFVISSGTMCRMFHESELHLIDTIFRINIYRESCL